MITPFLTEAERTQYIQVPKEISSFDLLASFHLSYEDLRVVRLQRRAANRLGFALQLGLLRFMGFLPEAWMSQVPPGAVAFVGKQIEVEPGLFEEYGQREATRTEHFNLILQHTGFQRWQPMDARWLEQWILERAGPPMLRMGRSRTR
jgi:TnpA family transposase